MSEQSEALRLADELEDDLVGHDGLSIPRLCQDIADAAAAELRWLHAEVEEQCRLNGMGSEREARLMAEIARRDAKEADAKAFVEERKAHWAEQIALGKAKIEADRPCWEQLSELQAENEAFSVHLSERMKDLARVETENEALRADAERYRWLRDNSATYTSPSVPIQLIAQESWSSQFDGYRKHLDAAIDAARSTT